MIGLVRKITIRILLPIWWRLFDDAPAKALNKFSIVEFDSAWQSLKALQASEEAEIRAKLFRHAFEEIAHGEIFLAIATSVSKVPLTSLFPERNPILKSPDKKGFTEFYADEFVGENRIQSEFETYYSAVPFKNVKAVFEKVKKDEWGHALYTSKMLDQMVDSNVINRNLRILRADLKYGYQAWLRFSKSIGELYSDLVLKIIYFTCGLFLKSSCKRTLNQKTVLTSEKVGRVGGEIIK